MKTAKYFAVANANGLISHMLEADSLSSARTELAEAVESGEARNWVDAADTDMEDDLDCTCPGISAERALRRCAKRGAELVYGENTSDSWNIWSVEA